MGDRINRTCILLQGLLKDFNIPQLGVNGVNLVKANRLFTVILCNEFAQSLVNVMQIHFAKNTRSQAEKKNPVFFLGFCTYSDE